MFCLQCGTQNPSDSKFCKECGERVTTNKQRSAVGEGPLRLRTLRVAENPAASSVLAEGEDGEQVNPQLQRLIEMAFWHNQAGNTPAAIMACETALMVDGDSTTALSLLGCLYEKQGELVKAAYAFERVVELNPDSDADQEKLDAIKQGIYLRPVAQPLRYRWMPPALVQIFQDQPGAKIGTAIAVGLVVFLIGFGIVRGHDTTVASSYAPDAGGALPASLPQTGNILPTTSMQSQPMSPPRPAVTVIPAINQPIGSQAGNDPLSPDSSLIGNHLRSNAFPNQSVSSTVPPLSTASLANPDVPYSTAVTPITVPASQMQSAIQVMPGAGIPQHTMVVGQADSSTQQVGGQPQSSDSSNNQNSPPPASHIYIKVHNDEDQDFNVAQNDNTSAEPAQAQRSASAVFAVDRGATLQNKALKLQQKGDYLAAEKAYLSAIAAYKQVAAAGQSATEAKRGVDACQTGLQICQASQ